MDINKYKNTYELEKDIYEQYIEIRNNPLFKIKKKYSLKKWIIIWIKKIK